MILTDLHACFSIDDLEELIDRFNRARAFRKLDAKFLGTFTGTAENLSESNIVVGFGYIDELVESQRCSHLGREIKRNFILKRF